MFQRSASIQNGVSLASKYSRFFFSLARLIEDSERQLKSSSYDSLEFLVRRLDEYERTLATLTSRFCETYGCVPAQQNTVADLSYLCNRVAFLRSHFQRSLDCDDNSVMVSTPGNIRPLQIEHCNRPGRPKLAITQGQLEALQRDSGFRWSDVARILCVSARTLRRRRHELGMLVEGRQFSELTDTQLDDLTRQALQVTPAAGLRMVQGYLRQRGLVVQRIRVLHALRRVDPITAALRNARRIIRRVYNVPSPNSLW